MAKIRNTNRSFTVIIGRVNLLRKYNLSMHVEDMVAGLTAGHKSLIASKVSIFS